MGEAGGSIVNAASVCGLIGLPKMSPYIASKHAVVGLTKVAAKEYGPKKIRVNAIAPSVQPGI
jgi:NAD(P)-dependent dehydrogenase (short-subunit alcohol dehydrogenase family)